VGTKTGISWTESTWNPLTGCTQISPGCAHCYAKTLAEGMMQRIQNPRYKNKFNVTLHSDLVDLPKRWKTPRMIFVNSMSDLFHKDVPLDFIKRVFDTMNETPRHTYQMLTKRHERLSRIANSGVVTWTPNIWQGVSIENNRFTLRADYLRQVPASIRFISAEPLLTALPDLNLEGIHWLIAGGESGPKYRPVNIEHIRQVRDLCLASGTKFYFKQFGGIRPTSGGRELDGVEWNEFPETRKAALA
jgi:protein gp37